MEKIRTLGFYQPWGSLMLPPYNKIETRKVKVGKKAPFPIGKYLFYTTKKEINEDLIYQWCGDEIVGRIQKLFDKNNESTIRLHGYAIGIGYLWSIREMWESDEYSAFVKKQPSDTHTTWCLEFMDVHRIEPFKWDLGKQGVGFVPDSQLHKIKII